MPRFDSKSSGTKLPGHMTLIFSAHTRWKAFVAKKTVIPFGESVKNTQLSISDDRAARPCDWQYRVCKTFDLAAHSEWNAGSNRSILPP